MANNAKKDPNGTWHIQFRYKDWTGKSRKSSRKGFRTKKEAEEWLTHFLAQQSSDPNITLSDFWEIYKEDMSKRLKVTTIQNKELLFRKKIEPYFGDVPINEITAAKIRKWQCEMIEKGFKPTYLKSIHSQLSAVMNYAVNFYDLRSNPCKKAGAMGKCNADERPFWTLDEYNLFLDTVLDKYEAWMGFQILFWTGMRIGELLALRVEDIDFENKTIRIDESYTRLNQKDIYSTPKTEKSVRVITIHDELCDEIKEYISHIYRAKSKTRLFAEKTKHYFTKTMKSGIKESGVKEISLHCLRHSHATMLVGLGFSPQEIARRLGHARVTTTIETYCHPSMDAQMRIANTLGKICQGEENE